MKHLKYFIISIAGIYVLFSCSSNPKERILPENLSYADNEKIGFVIPEYSKSYPDSSPLFISIKQMNEKIIFLANIEEDSTHSFVFSVSKYVNDSAVPMEIVFIEECLKYNSAFYGAKSKLLDFGVYDLNNTRYRYKITQTPFDDVFKQMYFFMKNDKDTILYELSFATNLESFYYADSVLRTTVESFLFLK